MTQDPIPPQNRTGAASSIRTAFVNRFSSILNWTIPRPSGKQYQAQEGVPQGHRRKGAVVLGMLLGLLLGAVNAAVLILEFYVIPYPWYWPDLGLLSRQSGTLLLLQDMLLCFCVFFSVGMLCGYITGTIRAARRISSRAGLIGAPSIILLTLVFPQIGRASCRE